jgi:hypothetical protein
MNGICIIRSETSLFHKQRHTGDLLILIMTAFLMHLAIFSIDYFFTEELRRKQKQPRQKHHIECLWFFWGFKAPLINHKETFSFKPQRWRCGEVCEQTEWFFFIFPRILFSVAWVPVCAFQDESWQFPCLTLHVNYYQWISDRNIRVK